MPRKIIPITAILLVLNSFGQPASSRLAFEVTSIKRSLGDGPFGIQPLPAKFKGENVTPMALLIIALNLPEYRILGLPEWTRNEKYDILAEAGRKITMDERRQMLLSLLEDRFKLVLRKETRDLPIYVLVVAKNGPKLVTSVKTDGRAGMSQVEMGKYAGTRATIQNLADMLTNTGDRPVRDKTDLDGTYDFVLQYDPKNRAGTVSDPSVPLGPSIFTAIQEQLGLRLEAQKGPVDVYVVDHIERPSAN